MKVMIVDDNEQIRDVIKSALAGPDMEFAECWDGGEAISQFSQFQPDWVLMDLSMAYVDGITAISELKAMFPEARVAVVTDHNEQKFRDDAKEAGAEKYILKENLHDLRSALS
ncbi:MAG TPA: response regulator transcription factor [Bacteroidota bacterium]